MDRLAQESLWKLTKRLMRQPASFLMVCGYLFFEYVRPQSMYPSMSGPPYTLIFILGTIGALAFEGRSPQRHPLLLALAAYTAIVVASIPNAYSPSYALENLVDYYLSWVVIILIVVSAVNSIERFFLFFSLYMLCSFKMAQHGAISWAKIGFGFRIWGVAGGPGWFNNSGEFGIQMCVFFPLGFYLLITYYKEWPRWKSVLVSLFPVTAVMSAVASSSRGALLGLAASAAWMLSKSRYKIRALFVLATVTAAVVVLIPEESKQRFSSAGDDHTSTTRLQYWRDGLTITKDHPVLGVGYANWMPYYQAKYNPAGQVPHNIFIQCMSELGLAGLAALIGILACMFYTNHQTRARARGLTQYRTFVVNTAHALDAALIGFLASGFFVTVLYYPYLWIHLALTASLSLACRRELRLPPKEIAPPHATQVISSGRRRGERPLPSRAAATPLRRC